MYYKLAEILNKLAVETKNIPVDRLKWIDRPSQREEAKASNFLMPEERKFPYKNKDGSINCKLVRAAITRAAQHGHTKVEAKARRIYEKYCKKQEG